MSTDAQDHTAQRDALTALDVAPKRIYVAPERIYVDHGLTGATRARPGPREAMAAETWATLSPSPRSTDWLAP